MAVKSFERVLQSHPEVEGKEESALLYKTVRNEVALMANLDHPNVVVLLGICIKPICMVLPRAPYGDLETVIEIYRSSKAQIRARPLQAALLEVLHTSFFCAFLFASVLFPRSLVVCAISTIRTSFIAT